VPEPGSTVRQMSLPTLQSLARSLGIGWPDASVAGVFDAMTDPWGETRPSALPMSDVSPDGSPIEFAIDLHPDAASVQIAVEPMVTGDDDTPANRALAARSAVARIARGYGADLGRWDAIAGLYLPEDAQSQHVAMLGAEIGRAQRPSFKVWLYPGICGIDGAPARVESGLKRLGLSAGWPTIVGHADGFEQDIPILFSIDLADDPFPRTKVYFRHYHTDPEHLARRLSKYRGYDSPDAGRFLSLAASDPGDFLAQPPVTCLTFRGTAVGEPHDVTTYVPLWTSGQHDEQTRERIGRLLLRAGIPASRYETVLAQVGRRPLNLGRGIHNYLSWQPRHGSPRMKVYMSPELRSRNPPPRYILSEIRVSEV
jgi:hypothetical protein